MINIPKIIHQIWLQGISYISNEAHERVNKIKNIHNINDKEVIIRIDAEIKKRDEQWKYKLWDEIQILTLLQTLDKEYIEKYYKFIYLHQKVDYAKFIILKIYGGIYIDIDCNIIKNLDKLFERVKDYDFICSYLSQNNKVINYVSCGYMDKCINNGIIISKKNTDICNYIINKLEHECESILDKKESCINNTTGPKIFNKIIHSYLNDNNNKSKVLILPPEYLEPCLFDVCNNTENTYIQHIHEWSWVDNNSYKNISIFYTRNTTLLNTICIIITIYFLIYIFNIYKSSL
jgi:mannosyltransferase OCH1-like enzyme